MRVLILSCNTGGGHNACGEAIRQAFEAAGNTCVSADALQFTSNKLSKFMSWGHTTMFRRIPKLFRFGYGYAENHPKMMREDATVVKLLTGGAQQLHSFLAAGGYDTVICTHVFAGLLLRRALDNYPMPIKTAFVDTDYTCSPGVAESELDVYFIPDASLAGEFMSGGVTGGKLVASGMPVLSQFYTRGDKEKAKLALGITPDSTHLLLMCGSMGCGPMKQLAELISAQLAPDQVLSVICGTNDKLQKDLEQKYGNNPNVRIYGDVVTPDGIPAIIDKELFERVQMRMAANKKAPARAKAEEEYLLTTKLYCGDCGRLMAGESGKGCKGIVYHYYKCSGAKRRLGCKKKAIKKHWIEEAVVKLTVSKVLTDEAINRIADAILVMQEQGDTMTPVLKQQLQQCEAEIRNVMKAIRQGIITETTKECLEDLETQRDSLKASILQLQLERRKFTKEEIVEWISKYKYGNINDLDYRKEIIDTFVNSVFVYEDKLVLTYNYKDGTETLTLQEIESVLSSNLTSMCPPTKRPVLST